MDKNDLFDNIDQGQSRPTIVNWENILNRIVDDYEPYATILHGVKKDANQNGWDARVEKKREEIGECNFLFKIMGRVIASLFLEIGVQQA